MAVSADLSKYLDKAYESKSLTEILASPVSALAGEARISVRLLDS